MISGLPGRDDAGLHKTVLLNEAVEALRIKADGTYVDATYGRGGHSRAILAQLVPAASPPLPSHAVQVATLLLPVRAPQRNSTSSASPYEPWTTSSSRSGCATRHSSTGTTRCER